MRWIGRVHNVNAVGEHGRAEVAPSVPDAEKVVRTARDLRDMVEAVRSEEFYWQEAHYDHDSRQGRELLFLMANHEWARATSEIIDIARSDAIETTIKIDVDLGQVTHEAFRKRTGPIWLPVAVLPPYSDHSRFEPDLFATVTDAAGDPAPMLPAADLRHQISAAMAEIIAKMAASRLPAPAAGELDGAQESSVATRDERLLLSAAIYRMLRHEPHDNVGAAGHASATEMPRITTARNDLRDLLNYYIERMEPRVSAGEAAQETAGERRSAATLARRAVKVLRALAESIIIVVQADYVVAPSVLTVRMPPRRLVVSKPSWIKPRTWIIRPAGRLEIDMLLPTADADRQIQINLPDGVSIDRKRGVAKEDGDERHRLDIAVRTPLPLQEFGASMDQVFSAHERAEKKSWPASLVQPFVDLALVKTELALDTLRHYEVSDKNDDVPRGAADDGQAVSPYAVLRELATDLGRHDDGVLARLKKAWQLFAIDQLSLSRRIKLDFLNPQTAVARANMIEDVSQRATPERATLYADVTVDDRDYFSTARSSAFMSLVLMLGVLGFLVGWHLVNAAASGPAPEVLAIVLTLFATIQADRIERPDKTTLRGQLFAIGNWLIAASVLPSLTLAVALGFQSHGLAAYLWASGCVVAQMCLLLLMRRGPLTPDGWPRVGTRRVLNTDRPDYQHFEALRSDYWRYTTAEALMIGRMAYGYVVWQKADPQNEAESVSPKLLPLLVWDKKQPTESSSILALLRAGTLHQAVTFVVFRGKPAEKWAAGGDDRNGAHSQKAHGQEETSDRNELGLDPGRLAPPDSVTSMVDVFVGVDRHEILLIKEHPLDIILRAAGGKLIVLDVQLPVPAPVSVYDDRQWARVRVALRDSGDIRQLAGFLGGIHQDMSVAGNARHLVAVQTVPAAGPRLLAEPGTAGIPQVREGEGEIPVLTSDLDVVNDAAVGDEPHGARTWRVLALCADARNGIENDIVRQLAAVRKHFELAGLTYALLHGTAVMLLLVHEPGVEQAGARAGRVVQPERDRARALEEILRKKPGCGKLRVLVYKEACRENLEPVGDHSYPMLRVRFRWQDRPGAFRYVLDAISEVLREELPTIERKDWSISYARIQVITGQVALGRMTIRMHVPPEKTDGWSPGRMEEMARKIESLAAEAAGQPVSGVPAGDLDRPEEPVIGIDRIMKDGQPDRRRPASVG
jgi:hypothetical protein